MNLVYSDDDLVVVNKPAGLLTHKSGLCRDRVTCMSLLRDHLGRWVYPIHRLDRATSGLIMFGMSPEIAQVLGTAMQERRIQKTYLAIVRGHVLEGGTLDKPLPSSTTGREKPAATEYEPIATTEQPWPVRPYQTARYTFMKLRPLTGRTHQLRRHMHSLSRPIVGDTKFGDGAHNAAFVEHLAVKRLMLHAAELTLTHPRTGESLRLSAPVDADFSKALQMFPGDAPLKSFAQLP